MVADFAYREVSAVYILGDHLSGPLWPQETYDFLRQQYGWRQIAGNHERQLLTLPFEQKNLSDQYTTRHLDEAALAWLAALPTEIREDDLLAVHASPGDDKRYLLETIENGLPRLATEAEIVERLMGESVPLILTGHSHRPGLVQLGDGCLILNPGSVGLQAYDDDDPPHVMQTGNPRARYALAEKSGGQWCVEFITLDYDYEAAAQKAEAEGRQDWAVAIRTGRVIL